MNEIRQEEVQSATDPSQEAELHLEYPWSAKIVVAAVVIPISFSGLKFCYSIMDPSQGLLKGVLPPAVLSLLYLFMIGFLAEQFFSKITLRRDVLTRESLGFRRSLSKSEIQSFRAEPKRWIKFFPKAETGKRSVTVFLSLKSSPMILEWASRNFPNLTQEESLRLEEEALGANAWEYSESQREQIFASVNRFVRFMRWSVWPLLLWGLLFSGFKYTLVIPVLISLPLVLLMVKGYFGNFVLMYGNEYRRVPIIGDLMLVSCMAVCARAVVDFDIIEYAPTFFPGLVIASVFTLLLLSCAKEIRKWGLQTVFVGLCALSYGFGVAILGNCLLDTVPVQIKQERVVSKWGSQKGDSCLCLKLAQVGSPANDREIGVSREFYSQVEIGDTISTMRYSGKLGIPWHTTTKDGAKPSMGPGSGSTYSMFYSFSGVVLGSLLTLIMTRCLRRKDGLERKRKR